MKYIFLVAAFSISLSGCGDDDNQAVSQEEIVQKAAQGDKKSMRDLENQVRDKLRAENLAAKASVDKPSELLTQFTKALMSGPPGNIEKLKVLAENGNPHAQFWNIRSTPSLKTADAETQAGVRKQLAIIAALDSSYQHQALSGKKWPLAAEAAFLISEDSLASGGFYPADMQQALHWLNTAAESGQPEAMFKLATRYQYGLDVEEDIETAKSWLKKSADAGSRDAERALAQIK